MHTCIHIHTCTHTDTHTCIQINKHTHMLTHTHTAATFHTLFDLPVCMSTNLPTPPPQQYSLSPPCQSVSPTHTPTHTHTHTLAHTHTHTYMHTHTCTHMHTHTTHTHNTNTHTHIYPHTHTPPKIILNVGRADLGGSQAVQQVVFKLLHLLLVGRHLLHQLYTFTLQLLKKPTVTMPSINER